MIRVVDGVVVQKDENEEIRCLEFEETAPDDDTRRLGELFDDVLVGLLSDSDAEEIGTAMAPDSSAAILVFEHTWATSLRDAISTAGGNVLADFRVPGAVVNEVLTNPGGAGSDSPNGRSEDR